MRVVAPPPDELLAGRRSLDGVVGFQLLRDWQPHAGDDVWYLSCRLQLDVPRESLVPGATDWYLVVGSDYPWGRISLYPSKVNGLTCTFHHQDHNSEGDPGYPWRRGKLCLDTSVKALGRRGYDTEPWGAHERLAWHVGRALKWLRAASVNELVVDGDPFELPAFPHVVGRVVAFREDGQSFDQWTRLAGKVGFVELSPIGRHTLVVRRFLDSSGAAIYSPAWGEAIQAQPDMRMGVWICLPQVPVIRAWQAPTMWGDLREVLAKQGSDLNGLLLSVAHALRTGKQDHMLLGFPIPRLHGDTPSVIHWQAIRLPCLSHGKMTAKGFRPNEKGYLMRDRLEVLRDQSTAEWVRSENWAPEELGTRGHFGGSLTDASIAVVGCGALGSVISEQLVRGGAKKLRLVDGDRLAAGNLSRHTLALSEVGDQKAIALSRRLNLLSPNTTVGPLDSWVDRSNIGTLEGYEVIIDCTGADALLPVLGAHKFLRPKAMFSISMGLFCRRLYVFSVRTDRFPHQEFVSALQPWLAKDLSDFAGATLPREGIGCWHPVFPGRIDDVYMLSACAVKVIDHELRGQPNHTVLYVYEQQPNDLHQGPLLLCHRQVL